MAKRKEQYALETAFIVSNLVIRLEAGTDRTLFATWSWGKPRTDHYRVEWSYYTGQGVWFAGNTEDLKEGSSIGNVRATYSPPANAQRVSVSVKPYSERNDKYINMVLHKLLDSIQHICLL